MNKASTSLGLLSILLSTTVLGGTFNLVKGNLLDTDTIDVEWHQQYGNCPTQFPVTSVNCTYTALNADGIKAIFINKYSQAANFTTVNTYVLNISVNHAPIASCRMLQQKVLGHQFVTINKTGCVVS